MKKLFTTIILLLLISVLITMAMLSYTTKQSQNNWKDEDFSFTTTYLWKESSYHGWEIMDIMYSGYRLEIRDSTMHYYLSINEMMDRIFEWKIDHWKEPYHIVETSDKGIIRVIEDISELNLERRGVYYVYDIQDSSRMVVTFGKIQEINEGYGLVNNDSTVMRIMLPDHSMVDFTNLLPDSLYHKK